MILGLISRWDSKIVDVKGAFLNGYLENSENIYMHVPQGLEKYHTINVVLVLLKEIYVTKQVVVQFEKELVAFMKRMFYDINKADMCIYFKWKATVFILCISWI